MEARTPIGLLQTKVGLYKGHIPDGIQRAGVRGVVQEDGKYEPVNAGVACGQACRKVQLEVDRRMHTVS